MDVGLYDSDTGESLAAEKIVDVTDKQCDGEQSVLIYTRAKRGRIVQLQQGALRVHYFLDEEGGQRMMREDSKRFGFDDFVAIARTYVD